MHLKRVKLKKTLMVWDPPTRKLRNRIMEHNLFEMTTVKLAKTLT